MKWQQVIMDLFTDEEGNLKMGQANQVTPDQVLAKMGIRRKAEGMSELAWFKLYGQAGIELNYFCRVLTERGHNGKPVIAGGINKAPTFYIIAANIYEQRLINAPKMRRAANGLKRLASSGRNVLPNIRKMDQLATDLDKAADVMEKKAPLQIAQ
jgi:hypothetical protein